MAALIGDVLAGLWRAATYRDTDQPHPHADAAARALRSRRPQDYDPDLIRLVSGHRRSTKDGPR